MNNSKLSFFISFFILFFTTAVLAQNPLNRKISVRIENKNIEDALSEIADAGSFNFSYNSDLIAADRPIAINASNQPVKEVLDNVMGKKMNYKVRGSYVIIQPPKQNKPKQKFKISGEIKDASTGEQISGVTIYEVNKFKSTLTGNDGKYDLTVSQKAEYVNVAISKKNYRDTVIRISEINPLPTSIALTPLKSISDDARSSVDSANLVKFFVPGRISKHTDNVELEEKRRIQISFLPFAGTNRLMSGKIANDLSFNIIAGYSESVEAVEVGGFMNIVRKNMSGVQVGGMANFVGGKTTGVQVAGFFNANGGNVTGVQAAGGANLGIDTITGWQVAGFANLAKVTDASQVSGFMNISWKQAKQVQLSGFVNYTKELDGMQMAGMANIASEKMTGGQVGVLNYAGEVRGFQLGIVNVADTVSSGINFGLINYVRKGLHKFEYARNDAMHNNLSFKTGTYKFYNILAGGYRVQPGDDLMSFGYGIGTQYNFKSRILTNLEITANSIHKGKEFFTQKNILGTLNLNIGYRFAKYLSVSAGPVLYAYVSDSLNPDTGEYGFGIESNPFFKKTFNDSDQETAEVKMWLGWQASVMF